MNIYSYNKRREEKSNQFIQTRDTGKKKETANRRCGRGGKNGRSPDRKFKTPTVSRLMRESLSGERRKKENYDLIA